MKFKIEIQGEEKFSREIKNLDDKLEDLSPAFRAAHKIFQEAEADNFQSDNSTGRSGKWKPLSEKYAEYKVKKLGFLGFVSLERLSDRLYKSLTGQTSDSIVEINKKDAKFGTSLPYAKAQHFGAPSKNLPSRPIIDLSEKQFEQMGNAMRKALAHEIKKTGFVMTDITDF